MFQGWPSAGIQALDMNEFYYNILTREERHRVESLEMFDEYEEWHLKCAHYFVLCACQGAVKPLIDDVHPFSGTFF